jgi:hypothetical protein
MILFTEAFTVGLDMESMFALSAISSIIHLLWGWMLLPWVSHKIFLEFAVGLGLHWQEKKAPAVSF